MSARGAVLGVACALLAAAQGAARADGARIFEDADAWAKPERAAVSDGDLFPNPPYTHDWQSRSFFLNGRLDDGTFFVINLFHWQLSFLQSWGLQVLVTDTAGRLFSYDGSLPPEDAADPPEGFYHRFGNNLFASAGNEQRVKLELSGFSCDLRFRNLLPAWEPGDGWAWLDAGHTAYVHYAVPCPLAVLGGSMLSFGDLRRVSGMCTWDSSLTVQPLGQANSPQYSLRAFGASDQPPGDRLFIGMVESFTDAHYGGVRIPVLFVARGGSWLFATPDFTVVPSGWTEMREPPYPFPSACSLHAYGNGWTLDAEVENARMYCATDVFQEIPPVIRGFLSAFLKRPVLYRMVGELHGSLRSPEGNESALSMPAHLEYVVIR